MICIEGNLEKGQKYFLEKDKLYFCPNFLNTDDSLQVQQVDVNQLSSIEILVESKPVQIDKKGREKGAEVGMCIGFTSALLNNSSVLTGSVLGGIIGESLFDNSTKEVNAVLKLTFKDNSTITMEVDNEEREQLFTLLNKNKDNQQSIITSAIYLSSLTKNQKNVARNRAWQIPIFLWLVSIPMIDFLKRYIEFQSEAKFGELVFHPNIIFINILNCYPFLAAFMILFHYIYGKIRNEGSKPKSPKFPVLENSNN